MLRPDMVIFIGVYMLVPESQNSELKDLLQSIVPAFNAHLEHAQMLQKKFK